MALRQNKKAEPWHVRAAKEFAGEHGSIDHLIESKSDQGVFATNPKYPGFEARFMNEKDYPMATLTHEEKGHGTTITENTTRVGPFSFKENKEVDAFVKAIKAVKKAYGKHAPKKTR